LLPEPEASRSEVAYTAAVTTSFEQVEPGQVGLEPVGSERAASALPRRVPATHSRAGNGMARTREAALSGAVQAVAAQGARKATMGDIATYAGIAKATLYNHFRTRMDVYRAAVEHEVERIAAAAQHRLGEGLDVAIEEAARLIADHPALRRIREEPAVLASLVAIGDTPTFALARSRIADTLCRDVDAPAVDLVLRYLVSQITSPSGEQQRRAAALLLAVASAR
jgi:AcrR family transcriptional regulator